MHTLLGTAGFAYAIGLFVPTWPLKSILQSESIYKFCTQFCQINLSLLIMALLYAALLMVWFLMYISAQSQYNSKVKCVFQGDEDTYTFYQGGDVVLGGLFPLHFSPISSLSSYKTKPKPTTYKLCVILLNSCRCFTFFVSSVICFFVFFFFFNA